MLQRINAKKLQWIALIMLALYPLAILAARLDIWHFRNSFLIFVVASLVGFVLLVISILKLSKQPQDEKSETSALLITIVATGLPLAFMGNNIMAAQGHPFIHDITTDYQQPPEFMAAKALRTQSDHDVVYSPDNIELQKSGYPDLKAIVLNVEAKTALHQAKVLMQKQGWEILALQDTQAPYTLEASTESTLFAFVDDMSLRFTPVIQPEGSTLVQTQVDMRSMSRQGKSDLGQNAKRITAFFELLQKP